MGLLRNIFLASLAILGSNAVSAVIDLIPSNFDDVVFKSGKPSLVEFFAPWCGRKYLLATPMIVVKTLKSTTIQLELLLPRLASVR